MFKVGRPAAVLLPAVLAAFLACSEEPQTQLDPNRYEVLRYVPVLDETVRIVKTPTEARVIRANGVVESLVAFNKLTAELLRERHGALTVDMSARLANMSATERIQVAVWYREPLAARGLAGSGLEPEDREDVISSNAALYEAKGDSLAAEWSRDGEDLHVYRISSLAPLIFAEATVDEVARLARKPEVMRVMDASKGSSSLDAGPPPNWVPEGNFDLVNAQGLYGAGQLIGFYEEHRCGIYAEHEAFGASLYTPSTAVPTCTTVADCLPCGTQAACAAGKCVSKHTTKVASAAIGTKNAELGGAAKAEIYQYLNPSGADFTCDPALTDAVYTDIVTRGIHTAVQAYTCSPTNTDGIVQDYYVRKYGISLAKTAGNTPKLPACPKMLNAICVGAHRAGAVDVDSGTTQLNPNLAPGYDREEPDLTAFSDAIDVAQTSGPTDWSPEFGTSFAAPSIAGMVAIMKEACSPKLDFSPLAVRALLSGASRAQNPRGWRYSTPGKVDGGNNLLDHADGAGAPLANFAIEQCSQNNSPWNVGSGTLDVDLTTGTTPPSGGAPEPGDIPPGEPQSTAPASSSTRWFYKLYGFDDKTLSRLTRIRASIAWNACPPSSPVSSSDVAEALPDFDLFLYNEDEGYYVYTSQSLDDNNEGFDVVIEEEGRHSLYLGWPKDGNTGLGCDGSTEALAYVYGWLPP